MLYLLPFALAWTMTLAPASTASATPPCIDAMNSLLQQENFSGVIAASEQCRAQTQHPRTHYLTGVAHMALNHPALAVPEFRKYLADVTAGEPVRLRSIATVRLEEAVASTGVVVLRVTGASALKAIVALTVQPVDATGQKIDIPHSALESRELDGLLRLDPGQYRVTLTRDAGSSSVHVVTVRAGQEAVLEVPLLPNPLPTSPQPAPAPAPRPRLPTRAWVAATASAGGASGAVGLAVSSLGWLRGKHQLSADPAMCSPIDELDQCRGNIAAAMRIRGAGAGLLGAGVGALVGGLTALETRANRRVLAWRIESGLGGALSLAGAIALGVGLRGFNESNTDASLGALLWGNSYAAQISAQGRTYLLGAGLVGAGISLSATAVVALLLERRVPRRAGVATRWQLRAQGLAVSF